MREFSQRTRAENLDRLAAEVWDVLVVGGGIVGAGVARDAAMRGMRVALVEKEDFAAGTSGKTSKLVHGGLRYLEDFRFRLVRQAIRERDLWLRNEPRLVRPMNFLLPAHTGGDSRLKIALALRVYAWFSRTRSGTRAGIVSREDVAAIEPTLGPPGMRGAGRYFDASVPDARLVIETIRSAAESGAVVANHAELIALLQDGNAVAGAKVLDRMGGQERAVRTHFVVNAAGPWLDRLRALVDAPPRLRPTKGVHVLVRRERVGNRHAIALRAPDGRIVFVLPWGAFSLIGTTDTDYRGNLDEVRATERDVAYLLAAANVAFPNARLTASDVLSTYAGVRPLVDIGRRARESDISREHEILEDHGMISIAGGKLTTHRAMAEEVVDLLASRLAARGRGPFAPCRTADLPLRPPPNPEDAARVRELVANPDLIARLLDWYDPADLREHLEEDPTAAQPVAWDVPYLWAEVDHAARHEMVCTLADFAVRRTWIVHEAKDHGMRVAPAVAGRLAGLLGWDRERLRTELAAYESEARRCVPVPDTQPRSG